jgi:hypothetical protein
MANHVVEWLNKDIGPLARGYLLPEDLEKAFAQGGMLEEVLCLTGLLQGTRAQSPSDENVKTYLKPQDLKGMLRACKKANVPGVSINLLADAQAARAGAAASILLKIKAAHWSSLQKRRKEEPLPTSTVRPKAYHRMTQGEESQVDLALPKGKALLLSAPELIRSQELRKIQLLQAKEAQEAQQACAISKIRQRRQEMLEAQARHKNLSAEEEREHGIRWKESQQALRKIEERLLEQELEAIKCREDADKRASSLAAFDGLDGVNWFETHVARQGLIGSSDESPLAPTAEDEQAYWERLNAQMTLTQGSMTSATDIERLRTKVITERTAKKERKARERKLAAERLRAHGKTESGEAREREIQAHLEAARKYEESRTESWVRQKTKQATAELREHRLKTAKAAFQSNLDRDLSHFVESSRKRHIASAEQRSADAAALRERLAERRREKRAYASAMCAALAHEVITLSTEASEMKSAAGGGPLTPSQWISLKSQFVSGDLAHEIAQGVLQDETGEQADEDGSVTNPACDAGQSGSYVSFLELQSSHGSWRPAAPPDLAANVSAVPDPTEGLVKTLHELLQPTPPALHSFSPVGPAHVILTGGQEGQLADIALCLGSWTGLYCTSMEDALQVAVDWAMSEEKNADNESAPDAKEEGAAAGDDEEATLSQERLSRAFSSTALSEDIQAFKEAARKYNADINDSKRKLNLTLSSLTDLLVLHLKCAAGADQGWILYNYPSTLLEAKMLEHALSGYTDEDVETEHNGGKPPKKEKPKGAAKGGESLAESEDASRAQSCTHRSALDAVIYIPASSTGVNDDTCTQAGGSDTSPLIDFWNSFKGALYSQTQPSNGSEALLEELYLLLGAAAERNRDKTDEKEKITDVGVDGSEKDVPLEAEQISADWKENVDGKDLSAGSCAQILPRSWELPLSSDLDVRRARYRQDMQAATLLWLEEKCGERTLDMDTLTTVLNRWKKQGIEAYESLMRKALGRLEIMLHHQEFQREIRSISCQFESELLAWDDRWTFRQTTLEEDIAAFAFEHGCTKSTLLSKAATKKFSNKDAADDLLAALERIASPPPPHDSLWDSIDHFEVEAGDVAEERYKRAHVLLDSTDAETSQVLASSANFICQLFLKIVDAEIDAARERKTFLSSCHDLLGAAACEKAGFSGQDVPPKSAILSLQVEARTALAKEVSALKELDVLSERVDPLLSSLKELLEEDEQTEDAHAPELTASVRLVHRVRSALAKLVLTFTELRDFASHSSESRRTLVRQRTRLEHNAISSTASSIRLALEKADGATLSRMVEYGCLSSCYALTHPVQVFPRPEFALDWGAAKLKLDEIEHLASGLNALAEHRKTPSLILHSDMECFLQNWATSASEAGLSPPAAWSHRPYIDSIIECLNPSGRLKIQWRRLIHSLLLGHLASPPSLSELLTMVGCAQSDLSSDEEQLPQGVFLLPLPKAKEVLQFWFEREGADESGQEKASASQSKDVSQRLKSIYLETFSACPVTAASKVVDLLELFMVLVSTPRINGSLSGFYKANAVLASLQAPGRNSAVICPWKHYGGPALEPHLVDVLLSSSGGSYRPMLRRSLYRESGISDGEKLPFLSALRSSLIRHWVLGDENQVPYTFLPAHVTMGVHTLGALDIPAGQP